MLGLLIIAAFSILAIIAVLVIISYFQE